MPRRLRLDNAASVRPSMIRTFHHAAFDPADLVRHKAGRTVSVCLPARNESATVGGIVRTIRTELVDGLGLVDEILVVDDHSTDATGELAARAGATVVRAGDVLPAYGSGHGKGEALWKSLYASRGDLVVWCDADIRNFGTRFVTGILGPLLTEPDLGFVKGYYDRPLDARGEGGGRTTELVARPLISLLHPQLAPIVQPLAGEYGGCRELLEQVPFVEGYGVDLALLIDLAARFGIGVIGQVDLGARIHRNRPLDELGPQALAILHLALRRAGATLADTVVLQRPGVEPVEVDGRERPPLATVKGYGPTALTGT